MLDNNAGFDKRIKLKHMKILIKNKKKSRLEDRIHFKKITPSVVAEFFLLVPFLLMYVY